MEQLDTDRDIESQLPSNPDNDLDSQIIEQPKRNFCQWTIRTLRTPCVPYGCGITATLVVVGAVVLVICGVCFAIIQADGGKSDSVSIAGRVGCAAGGAGGIMMVIEGIANALLTCGTWHYAGDKKLRDQITDAQEQIRRHEISQAKHEEQVKTHEKLLSKDEEVHFERKRLIEKSLQLNDQYELFNKDAAERQQALREQVEKLTHESEENRAQLEGGVRQLREFIPAFNAASVAISKRNNELQRRVGELDQNIVAADTLTTTLNNAVQEALGRDTSDLSSLLDLFLQVNEQWRENLHHSELLHAKAAALQGEFNKDIQIGQQNVEQLKGVLQRMASERNIAQIQRQMQELNTLTKLLEEKVE